MTLYSNEIPNDLVVLATLDVSHLTPHKFECLMLLPWFEVKFTTDETTLAVSDKEYSKFSCCDMEPVGAFGEVAEVKLINSGANRYSDECGFYHE